MSRVISGIILISLAAMIFSGGSFAQDSTFKVTSFIPERFRDLELKVEGAWDGTDFTQKSSGKGLIYSSSDLFEYQTDTDNNGVRLSPILNYRFWSPSNEINYNILFDINYLKNNSADTNFANYRYDDTVSNKNKIASSLFDIDVNQDISFRHYFGSLFYLGNNLRLDMSYSKINYDVKGESYDGVSNYSRYRSTTNDSSGNEKSYQIGYEFRPGLGRIYEGFFAARAIYIIEELKKKGFLKGEPTFDQMNELAEIIYRYDQKHIIDSRIRRIDALGSIIDYLLDEGILQPETPRSVLIIQDVWEYFPEDRREFGSTIELGAGLQYSFKRTKTYKTVNGIVTRTYYDSAGTIDSVINSTSSNSNGTNYKDIGKSLYFYLDYKNAVPLNFRWQGSFSFETYYSPYNVSESETNNYSTDYTYGENSQELDYQYSIDAILSLKNIISSRSELIFNTDFELGSLKYYNYYTNTVGTKYKTETTWRSSKGIEQTIEYLYRISIPTTFNVNARYTFSRSNYRTESGAKYENRRNGWSFGAGIVYYIL